MGAVTGIGKGVMVDHNRLGMGMPGDENLGRGR